MTTGFLAASTTSAGPLLFMGAAVVLLAVMGFTFLAASRRKKRPEECAEQRAALAAAENALQSWQRAVAHLQVVESGEASSHLTDDGSGEGLAERLQKAIDGRSAAARHRDQCQLELIHCLGQVPMFEPLGPVGFESPIPTTHDANAPRPVEGTPDA